MHLQKYSRQYYSLNEITNPNGKILVSNITGLAIEIIKNLLLQGHKLITLHDNKPVLPEDICTNYYSSGFTDTNKADYFANKLHIDNNSTQLNSITLELTPDVLAQYDIVIFVGYNGPNIIIDTPHIIVNTWGASGQILYNIPNVNSINNYDDSIYSQNNMLPLVPVNSIMGSFVAQDVLKFMHGIPIATFKYKYFRESFFEQNNNNLQNICRYQNQIQFFGQEFQNKLKGSTCFIVGMGSLGNEILKNLLMMGVGTIIITDPKTITLSNTGTQFLFNSSDVGKQKTKVAKNTAKQINDEVHIINNEFYVSDKTNNIYNKQFYEKLTCVFGAVDNAITRAHIDSRCVLFKIPYIDCGSDAFLGHVQVVVPHLTESYNSSNDTIDKSYPLCAIASFPTMIEHCILWAQEQLEIIFCKNITTFKNYLENPQIINTIEDVENTKKVLLNIFNSISNNYDGCYLIATEIFNTLYHDMIADLLNKFPSNYLLDDGTLFWSPPKQCPHVIPFNTELSHAFANKCAKLWMKTFVIPPNTYFPQVTELPENLDIYINIIINIQNPDAKLVYYASTLRSTNYDIDPISEFDNAKIFENIIPRLVSTSSIVAGLACIEFYKLVQKNDDTIFKNSFVNTRNNEIIQSEPILYAKNGLYNIWDSFVVTKEEVTTVRDFVDFFQNKHQIEVTAIIYGSFMFYSTMYDDEKLANRLNMNIIDIIENEMKIKLESTITLQVYDDGDGDYDLPEVLFIL